MFQSQTGFPGHLAKKEPETAKKGGLLFQSQTGFPGHLAISGVGKGASRTPFQSQTGFPGHLANTSIALPLRSAVEFQSQTGFPGHLAPVPPPMDPNSREGFNPRRASQAI